MALRKGRGGSAAPFPAPGERRAPVVPLLALLLLVLVLALWPFGRAAAIPEEDPAILIVAGDIAGCETDAHEFTAYILDTLPGTIATLGDHAYPDGTWGQFNECYHPSWGRHRERTRPSPGNHDYHTRDAAGYFRYFGSIAGPGARGYYSYDLGDWHIISLNSEIPTRRGSPQERWLRRDLEATDKRCILAYWHKPLFSSVRRPRPDVKPLWDALYEAGATVVLAGHDHVYERFAPQSPDGKLDTLRGIRQFTVGTGGFSLYPFSEIAVNSEVRQNSMYGVLKLTLRSGSYDWEFVPVIPDSFADSGSEGCRTKP